MAPYPRRGHRAESPRLHSERLLAAVDWVLQEAQLTIHDSRRARHFDWPGLLHRAAHWRVHVEGPRLRGRNRWSPCRPSTRSRLLAMGALRAPSSPRSTRACRRSSARSTASKAARASRCARYACALGQLLARPEVAGLLHRRRLHRLPRCRRGGPPGARFAPALPQRPARLGGGRGGCRDCSTRARPAMPRWSRPSTCVRRRPR
jgi:hypothetical protein